MSIMTENISSGLYLVSTPIGNLEDISFRAINILNSVDIIACEDTRHSLKLLNHYNIKKRLIAYHSYNEENSANGILNLIQSGKSVALITDGGTPCISDPGWLLVKKCIDNNIIIVSVPGASAIIAALVISGFRTDKFCFIGFLSPKSGKRRTELEKYKSFIGTIVLYESPYRLIKTIGDVNLVFGDKDLCLIKELTKINEKKIIAKPKDMLELLINEKIIGEYVLLIANY